MASHKAFRLIGLTGGIASGKSLAARIFSETGVPVIDADQISRKLSEKGGPAFDAIAKRFGTTDRAELRKLVFSDPKARKDLEGILHPLILSESMKAAKDSAEMRILTGGKRSDGLPPAVLYEAALLVETGRYKDLDGLIVVDSPIAERLKRLMARDRISESMAQSMIASQANDFDRIKAADFVLRNAGTEAELRKQISEAIAQLKL